MSFIGDLLSGNRGMSWNASGTDIQQPATMAQAQTAYDQTQQGLANQNAFLQALRGQNAIQNQTALTGTLQNMVAGGGPNPALTQFQRTQGENTAATNAAIAGARGATANPAAVARAAGRVGADANMKAATDAATLKQQQQLGAIGALGTQLGSQVTNLGGATNAYSTAAQNQAQNINNAIAAANQARVGMQSNINNANANINAITAQGQNQLLGGIFGGTGSAMQLPIGATGGAVKKHQIGNNPRAYLAEGADPMNAPTFNKEKPPTDFMTGFAEGMRGGEKASPIEAGLTNFGKGIGSLLRGDNKKEKGMSPAPRPEPMSPEQTGKSIGEKLTNKNPFSAPYEPNLANDFNYQAQQSLGPSRMGLTNPGMQVQFSQGGKVPAMVSPGEKYLTPHQAQSVLKGKENPLNGKTIPGKAKVKGDSYDNDTVPVTLEEGGCVIPRSVLQSDQPMKNAIKFVHEHMKKMAKGGKVEHKKSPELSVEQETIENVPEKMKLSIPPEAAHEVLRQSHFIFSPSNPHEKPELNLSPDQVMKLLKDQGMLAEEAFGVYPNKEGVPTPEPSIVVHDVKDEHLPQLFELARMLGQESAIHSKGGHHTARYLNGENAGKLVRGKGTQVHEEEPENYYTKTKNGLIFSHDIDWDHLHDK